MTSDAGFAFIVGHRKSGSTWLLNMVSLHPDVRGLAETNLFNLAWTEPDPVRRTDWLFSQSPWSDGGSRALVKHHLLSLAAPLVKHTKPALALTDQERPGTLHDLPFRDRAALQRELRGLQPPDVYVHRFFHFLKDRLRPRSYLIEKSPRNVNRTDRIRALFPKAKLIVIYRDGRDVVTSDKFFTRDHVGKCFDFVEATQQWRSDMEAQLKFAAPAGVFACAYENLLADGPTVARDLFRFLDLPCDDCLIEKLLERSSFRFYAGRERGQEDRKRFYRKGIVGDWKNNFDDQEKRTFKELAGDMLVQLGYERDLSW